MYLKRCAVIRSDVLGQETDVCCGTLEISGLKVMFFEMVGFGDDIIYNLPFSCRIHMNGIMMLLFILIL